MPLVNRILPLQKIQAKLRKKMLDFYQKKLERAFYLYDKLKSK